MEKFSGQYRFVSAENPLGMCRAWFGNGLTTEQMEAVMAPDNKVIQSYTFTDTTVGMSFYNTKIMELNLGYEYVVGKVRIFEPPYNCRSTVTYVGTNVLKDVYEYPEGGTYTTLFTFTSQGMNGRTTLDGDYVGSFYFERVEVDMTGFYVIESHQDLDKTIMEDSGMSAAAAQEMVSSLALRITETNGVITMVDYFSGGSKETVFQVGVESDYSDTTFNITGSQLVTKTGPGAFTFVYKDEKSGKTTIWEANFYADYCMFKVVKPLNTQGGSVKYRRLSDVFGDWKMLTTSDQSTLQRSLGMPEDMLEKIMAERPTMSFRYLSNGMIKWDYTSDIFDVQSLTFKSGEEFSYSMHGVVVNEVIVHTKQGVMTCAKMAGKARISTCKVSKNFMVIEMMVEGEPGTKATAIYKRI